MKGFCMDLSLLVLLVLELVTYASQACCVWGLSSLMVDSPPMGSSLDFFHYVYGEERCASILPAGARVCCFGTQCPLHGNSMGKGVYQVQDGERYGIFEPFARSNSKKLTGSAEKISGALIFMYLLSPVYKVLEAVWENLFPSKQRPKKWKKTRVERLCSKLIPHLGINNLQGYYGDVERQILFIHVDSGYRKIVKDQVIMICRRNKIDVSGCKFKYIQQNSSMEWQSACIPSGGAIAEYPHANLNRPSHANFSTVLDIHGSNGLVYGTMTGPLEDGEGNNYALTAAHVLKGKNFKGHSQEEISCVCDRRMANGNSRILPISGTISSIRYTVQHGLPFGREKFYVDVSAVRITLPRDTHPEYKGLPAGTTRPRIATDIRPYLIGTEVEKYGATSKLTSGTIVETNYHVNIDGQIYSGMIIVRNNDPHKDFTEGGDSGALVTGVGDDNNAYGLHMSLKRDFSLDGQGTFNASIMCRLDKTLAVLADRFNLNLDFKENR